ncbi:MAG: alpha/beta hydrolase [Lewinella sp.]|uniref:alpha/beta hydrolase n=1 Tax=Lewinella sp. TaxID=2004506 RepID=UPI003D6AF96C
MIKRILSFQRVFLLLLLGILFLACQSKEAPRYLFFLHNRFLEDHPLEAEHLQYGRTEYEEIKTAFANAGLKVVSEKRPPNTNARTYASAVVRQIDSLITLGVPADHITIVGTSKGGYIAQYVSTLAANPQLSFVFVASFQDSDIEQIPEINYCGNILTIYECSDRFGVSAIRRKETSNLPIPRFEEIELNTGLGHGFLFKPLPEWIVPTIKWAKAEG